MGLALFKERRLSDRRKLTGLLPGRLTIEGTKLSLSCRPVDVSANGMGVVMAREIEPGTQMTLSIGDHDIALQVAWGQPDFGKQDMFRYGLVTLDPNVDLEAEFVRAGCLR
jgi:hypothetical protein